MKARLVPVYFEKARNQEFDEQVKRLREMLSEEAFILEPVPLGSKIPEADAVVFPQLVGEAYKSIKDIKKLGLPLIVVTSEFGTVAMWDWEIVTFLKTNGLDVFAPYDLKLTKVICRTLGLKRSMQNTKFLVFQDNPGEGMQASIFKRFYWWEDECSDLIKKRFGISIVKKSFKELAENAKKISDEEAKSIIKNSTFNTEYVSYESIKSAIKLYISVKREIENVGNVGGVGINCLNESFYSDTTPCLAWNMIFQESGIMWACEADTMSLLTKYITHKALNAPIMMSNLYPFLMGMAALKHEKIDKFPDVEEPDRYMLVAHCGYFGLLPECFATEWTLRPKVLEIVDDNATAIDARLPVGDVTLIKLHPTFEKILVVKGELEDYVQYPNSDCRNGALIKVENGHKLMDKLYSHHSCFIAGHKSVEVKYMTRVLGLNVEEF